jgi:hypothetical protein
MSPKKSFAFFTLIFIALFAKGQTVNEKKKNDWLINNTGYVASITKTKNGKDLIPQMGDGKASSQRQLIRDWCINMGFTEPELNKN